MILTIQHDAGNDLIVPLQAASGSGFCVMDGGSIDNPGAIVPADWLLRASIATHLRSHLRRRCENASASCSLYYPYGNVAIGRGNAVTDNYSHRWRRRPAGTSPATSAAIGGWNFPLAATAAPIALSDIPG